MYCKKCGKRLQEDDLFCSGCGEPTPNFRDKKSKPINFEAEENSTSNEAEERAPGAFKVSPLTEEFIWDIHTFSDAAPKGTDDIDFDWGNMDIFPDLPTEKEERETVEADKHEYRGFVAEEKPIAPEISVRENKETETKTEITKETKPVFEEKPARRPENDPINLWKFTEFKDEGPAVTDEARQQAEKIDKFYTFNQKNEEFQKLLDKEYEKIKKGNVLEDEQTTAEETVEENFVPRNIRVTDELDEMFAREGFGTEVPNYRYEPELKPDPEFEANLQKIRMSEEVEAEVEAELEAEEAAKVVAKSDADKVTGTGLKTDAYDESFIGDGSTRVDGDTASHGIEEASETGTEQILGVTPETDFVAEEPTDTDTDVKNESAIDEAKIETKAEADAEEKTVAKPSFFARLFGRKKTESDADTDTISDAAAEANVGADTEVGSSIDDAEPDAKTEMGQTPELKPGEEEFTLEDIEKDTTAEAEPAADTASESTVDPASEADFDFADAKFDPASASESETDSKFEATSESTSASESDSGFDVASESEADPALRLGSDSASGTESDTGSDPGADLQYADEIAPLGKLDFDIDDLERHDGGSHIDEMEKARASIFGSVGAEGFAADDIFSRNSGDEEPGEKSNEDNDDDDLFDPNVATISVDKEELRAELERQAEAERAAEAAELGLGAASNAESESPIDDETSGPDLGSDLGSEVASDLGSEPSAAGFDTESGFASDPESAFDSEVEEDAVPLDAGTEASTTAGAKLQEGQEAQEAEKTQEDQKNQDIRNQADSTETAGSDSDGSSGRSGIGGSEDHTDYTAGSAAEETALAAETDEVGEEDGQEKSGKGHTALKVILIILIVMLAAELAMIGIKWLAPSSQMGKSIDKATVKVVQWVNGIFSSDTSSDSKNTSDKDGTVQRTKPVEDKTSIIKATENKNKNGNIKAIEYNSKLKYDPKKTYAHKNINKSEKLSEVIWYEDKDGKTVYYDEEAIGNVIAFDSQKVDLVNKGSKSALKLVEKGTPLYTKVDALKDSGMKITFDKLAVGEIRRTKDEFYLWTGESTKEKEKGKTSEKFHNRIYQLKVKDKEMLISSYYDI